METSTETFVSIIGIIFSLIALIFTFLNYTKLNTISSNSTNLELIYRTESRLWGNENLLKLHNIDKSELDAIGVSLDEFTYIMQNLRAGQSYYYLTGLKKNKRFTIYRTNFLNNEKVKNCYINIIRNRMIADGRYSRKIDKYYNIKN